MKIKGTNDDPPDGGQTKPPPPPNPPDEKPKIVGLTFKPTSLQIAVSDLARDTNEMIASQTYFAKIIRAKYLALIAEGFTEKQALELSKRLEV